MTELNHIPTGHETDDADIRAIVVTGIIFSVSVAVILWMVWGMFQYLAHRRPTVALSSPLAETERQQFPPLPRLEEHPAVELEQMHKQEDYVLSTYGWVDKKAGVVRIPIDRAMELQLEKGFPIRKQEVKK